MDFRILDPLSELETIAAGTAIREIKRLRRTYARYFVVCLGNAGYEASLEPRKFYLAPRDADAAAHGQLRVVDESGEDYLFPASYFATPSLSPDLRRRLLAAV